MAKYFTVTVFMAVFLLGMIAAKTTLEGKPNALTDEKEDPVVAPAKNEDINKVTVGEKKFIRQLEGDQINDAVNSAIQNAKNDPSVAKNQAYLSVSKTAGKPANVTSYISQTKGN